MLSGETAVGSYPVQAVHMMARTGGIAEDYVADNRENTTRPPARLRESKYRTAALAHGVSTIVNDLKPKFVVTWSELGGGARYLSQNRLGSPIIAISSKENALRQMALLFGVHPFHMDRPTDTADFLARLDDLLLSRNWVEPGDPVVIVKGEPLGIPGVTNMIRIHYVGDVCRLTWHVKDDES
jgi:pyruvate kinase